MKIICKCGNLLTKELSKVHHKDAYNVKTWDEEVGTEDDPYTYEHKEYSVKEGSYHEWEMKDRSWGAFQNSYVISDKDFVGVEMFDQSKGCCRFDYYGLKCSICGTHVGYGNNDCWQEDSAFLYTIKTKVVQ